MTPGDFRLCDLTACAAVAIDEHVAGRTGIAWAAWCKAHEAAAALAYPDGTPQRVAAALVLWACIPGREGNLADLRNALDAASTAALLAIGGDVAGAERTVSAALGAAIPPGDPQALPADIREAVTVLLREIRRTAREQAQVTP